MLADVILSPGNVKALETEAQASARFAASHRAATAVVPAAAAAHSLPGTKIGSEMTTSGSVRGEVLTTLPVTRIAEAALTAAQAFSESKTWTWIFSGPSLLTGSRMCGA